MSDSVHLVARALTSVVFIVFGFLQFTNIDAYTANPAIVRFASLTGGVIAPVVVAYLVAAIDLFGGLLMLVGYQTRWAAIILIVFVVLTLIFAHPYWTFDGPSRAANQVQFYKNLAIIGALLFLIVLGPGRYSLDKGLARS
ncbi:MAG: DoxX family protein [Pseudolabrys sp.]